MGEKGEKKPESDQNSREENLYNDSNSIEQKKNIQDNLQEKREDLLNRSNLKEKKVIIKAEAYKSIILYATRYANASIPREQWKEIYGILIGYINKEKNAVIVESAEPMTYGESTDVELSAQHYGFIAEIEDRLYNEGNQRFMVGWFHSHPGLTLFFSWVDVKNQLAFQQANPDFLGIVFDHSYLVGPEKPQTYENHPNPNNPDYIVTKDHPNSPFHTGIVCYRLNDTTMSLDHPLFDQNYHDVEYEIDGLNQFFFANLLTEISAMAAAGKPLQQAYKEDLLTQTKQVTPITIPKKISIQPKSEHQVQNNRVNQNNQLNQNIGVNLNTQTNQTNGSTNRQRISLVPKAKSDLNNTGVNSDGTLKKQPIIDPNTPEGKIATAKNYIIEGKMAFKLNDSFSAIENYNIAIETLKQSKEPQIVQFLVNTLSDLIEQCLATKHDQLVIQYSEQMKTLAEEIGDLFQLGNSDYFKGRAQIRMGNLEEGLKTLKNATVLYENAGDFAGVAKVNEMIGDLLKSAEDYDSVALFYAEAINNYKRALKTTFPKRNSIWALPKNIKNSIQALTRSLKEEIMKKVKSKEIIKKIEADLKR